MLVGSLILLSACQQSATYRLETAESGGYTYEYVTNDPLQVRIYTLRNGLKVYLSRYTAEPRIFTQIAVKAGGKNDPATHTGLAHYLEHIMFKGTADFGTLDWKSESVLLDSIERMFNHYGTLTDSLKRVEYYKQIDRVSYEASKYIITNEYDKMVSSIGARATNAYTSEDRTVYINDIPANQLVNWITIEANRFRKIVPRLFHTELETVYEEKNRSLDNDWWKAFEAANAALFPKHPYGTQTVIGTIEHLKNPSITEIKKYFDTYYRPNNVAICLSGDLDYDKTIALIDKYFGDWEPNENLPQWKKIEEEPIAAPVEKEVYGPDAEWVMIGFRLGGRNSEDYAPLILTNEILSNGQAGLIDINLKQQQKVLDPQSYVMESNDYSIHFFVGFPREGQSLTDVRDLLLEQIEKLKEGDFEDWLLEAAVNGIKKKHIKESEQNAERSAMFVTAFTNDIPWDQYTGELDALSRITKDDIVRFVNEHYRDNYVTIYKRHGKDPNTKRVTKPSISRMVLNKESKSPFHEALLQKPVDKLKPVFVDYEKDIRKLNMNRGVEVLSTPNNENDLFTLYYLLDIGSNNDPRLSVATEYLQYLGTSDMSAGEFKKELYRLGCSFGVSALEERTYIYLEGLNENMEQAVTLLEKLLADLQPDEEAMQKMIDGIFKKREDTKKDKFAILYDGLINYALYGPKSPFTNVLTNKQLRELKPAELIDILKGFTQTEHRVLYYGPKGEQELLDLLNRLHVLPEQLKPLPPRVRFTMNDITEPRVLWTHYDMVQTEIVFLMKGSQFNRERMPYSRVYNEYMGTQAFQELREAQGLAYSTWTYYGTADRGDDYDYFYGYVGTQADKQVESMAALKNVILNMPESEDSFRAAREAVLNQIESERIRKTGILFNYLAAQRRGLDTDIRRHIYEKASTMTIEDVKKFQQEYVKNAKFSAVLVASRDKLNMSDLKKYGKVKELSLDELFGYEKETKIDLETVGN